MRTFTVRDMDRRPSEILRACGAEGTVLIRSHTGRSYEIRPLQQIDAGAGASALEEWLEGHEAWLKQSGIPSLSASELEKLDRLIAGE